MPIVASGDPVMAVLSMGVASQVGATHRKPVNSGERKKTGMANKLNDIVIMERQVEMNKKDRML